MNHPLEHRGDEPQEIRIKRIKAGSLFSLIATAISSLFVPLILFGGVLAFFSVGTIGFETIHLTFRNVGFPGLLGVLVTAPIFSLVLSVAVWIVLYCGILIWSASGSITIAYVPMKNPKS